SRAAMSFLPLWPPRRDGRTCRAELCTRHAALLEGCGHAKLSGQRIFMRRRTRPRAGVRFSHGTEGGHAHATAYLVHLGEWLTRSGAPAMPHRTVGVEALTNDCENALRQLTPFPQ